MYSFVSFIILALTLLLKTFTEPLPESIFTSIDRVQSLPSHMERQIPLNVPQTFPARWKEAFLSSSGILSEEQLTREEYMTDEFYDQVRVGMNSKALVYAAMHAFSTDIVPDITRKGGGSFNAIFLLEFPNEFKVAARIPRRDARAAGRIGSTVAMMTMARYHRDIPVPEIYAWHPDDTNPVGAPYILMEWVEGIEPWEQWHDLPPNERTRFLDELAHHHANFAKPLPFHGIGSIYFAEPATGGNSSFADASAYRLGPMSRGPMSTRYRGITTWPETTPESLREFWLQSWQHEVDSIKKSFGSDRSTVIATADHPSSSIQEVITMGQFLDVAEAVLTLIQKTPLPPRFSSQLYEQCFAMTDYAFRNIKMDRQTHKIKAFIDWDDVYVLPFLLCSRYPEDICWFDGSGERWYKTGGFLFLPLDEEGEIAEDTMQQEAKGTTENNSESIDDDDSNSDAYSPDDEDAPNDSNDNISQPAVDVDLPEHETEDYDRPRRIMDTRLRREYEQLLATHDKRFGVDDLWEMRKEPLKIQHLVANGWIEWLVKEDWIKERAAELQR